MVGTPMLRCIILTLGISCRTPSHFREGNCIAVLRGIDVTRFGVLHPRSPHYAMGARAKASPSPGAREQLPLPVGLILSPMRCHCCGKQFYGRSPTPKLCFQAATVFRGEASDRVLSPGILMVLLPTVLRTVTPAEALILRMHPAIALGGDS